jgi:hypothetical protein
MRGIGIGSAGMRRLFWVSAALIAYSLLPLVGSGAGTIAHGGWRVQAPAVRRALNLPALCPSYDHADALARVALGGVGLLVLCFPFRRGQTWGWLALASVLGLYLLPVFVLPLGFPRWPVILEAVRGLASDRASLSRFFLPWPVTAHNQFAAGPAAGVLSDFFFPSLTLLGLLLSLPVFLRGKRGPTWARAAAAGPAGPPAGSASAAFRASAVLICSGLAGLFARSVWMVEYVQSDVRMAAVRHAPGLHLLCELQVHEAGFARIASGLVGLLIVLLAFRRRERWSWLGLAALASAYLPPLFALPLPFPNWTAFAAGVRQPELLWAMLSDLFAPTLMLAGLLLSLPILLRWRPTHGPPGRPRTR